MKKQTGIITGSTLVIWLLLFCTLQILYKYNFYITEHTQLFLYNGDHIRQSLNQPGGLALTISGFLIQFFAYPFAGAAILATILTLIGFQMYKILKKIAPREENLFFSLLPVTLLIFLHFSRNYFLQGTVSISMMLLAFYGFERISSFKKRLIYALITIPLLFYLAGSVSILFILTAFVYELFHSRTKSIWYLIPITEAILISAASVYLALIGDFRFAFLPDMYYHPYTKPNALIYILWASIPLAIAFGFTINKRKEIKATRRGIENTIQFAAIIIITWAGISRYKFYKYKDQFKLEVLAEREDWDGIIAEGRQSVKSHVSLVLLNIALANKGLLADQLFQFDQNGEKGLFPEWDSSYFNAALLSDMHYTIGNIAAAQRYAFEGNVIQNNESPRLLKRLIQTYLVNGDYQIAERHIRTLEQTLVYRNWARKHRKFLHNDAAIEAHPQLGVKRRSIPDDNFLYSNYDIDYVTLQTAKQNPKNRAAIEYIMAHYLLTRNLRGIQTLIESYYQTPLLPELPLPVKEAVFILYDEQPEEWKKYGISDDLIQHYYSFRNGFTDARKNPTLRSRFEQKYKNTYWAYFVFK